MTLDADVVIVGAGQAGLSVSHELRLWDSETGHEVMILRGQSRGFATVAFEPPNGNRFVSVGRDGTVLIWDATPVDSADPLVVPAPPHVAQP